MADIKDIVDILKDPKEEKLSETRTIYFFDDFEDK